MKKMRVKHNPNQPYFVGAEVVVHKEGEKEEVKAKLIKFGAKAKQAEKWLKSFPPINTPDGGEIKRLVFRLPMGYRERRDIIAQYKKRGYTNENARFHMLAEHAGAKNTLVYVQPTVDRSGGNPDQPNAKQPVVTTAPHEAVVSDSVGNTHGPESETGTGTVTFVNEDDPAES